MLTSSPADTLMCMHPACPAPLGEALLLAHMHPIAKKGRFWTVAWKIRIEIEQA